MNQSASNKILPWIIWFIATVFFAYQFILRLFPALIIHDIMAKFNITASQYGLLSAMYYAGYAGMQIPIAIFLDKYGPRMILFICSLLCALSSLAIVYSNNWTIILIGRFLVGAGSAAGFLGVSKVISIWFAPAIYGRMVGITFSLGLIGAVFGGRPISIMISKFNWELVTVYIGMVGTIIALFVLCFTSKPKHFIEIDNDKLTTKLKIILSNKTIILLSIASLLLVGTLEGFADVWGVSYLEKAYNISKTNAATIISFIFIGMIIGAPIIAFIAEKFNTHHVLASFCGIAMAVMLYLIFSLHGYLSDNILYILMTAIGVFCCYQVLVLTIGFTSVNNNLTGITIAFLNCVNMLGGSIFHSIIGNLLDHFWLGQTLNNIRIYDTKTYNYAMMVIPLAAILGSILFLIIRFSKSLYIRYNNN
jgi:predicted MFS family arabinose efflux permease